MNFILEKSTESYERYTLVNETKNLTTKITHSDGVDLLANNKKIREKFIKVLSLSKLPSYYFKLNSSEKTFSFTLNLTEKFKNADFTKFGDEIDTNKSDILVMDSLSKKHKLIIPTYNHKYDKNIYSDIGTFMRSNNSAQQDLLVKTMFEVYKQNGSTKMTTHGKGVNWLHIRIR